MSPSESNEAHLVTIASFLVAQLLLLLTNPFGFLLVSSLFLALHNFMDLTT